jgi:hypothetical protein
VFALVIGFVIWLVFLAVWMVFDRIARILLAI